MAMFDDDGTRQLQRVYSTPDVVEQRRAVLAMLALRPGERVLDVGSGPGFLAGEIADAVGPSGAVHGVDPSPAMNAAAREANAGRPWVHIADGQAMALPHPDDSFDVAVSTQVYEYVPDVTAALTDLHRVLRPGGRVLLLDTDWDSVVWHTADPARHDRIMAAWEEHLVHPRLPRTLPRHLREAGFRITGRTLIPIFNPVWDANTYSVLTMGGIGRFVVGRQGLTTEDVDAWTADLRARGEADEYLFSISRYCFTAETAG